jgi:hypothetical protein
MTNAVDLHDYGTKLLLAAILYVGLSLPIFRLASSRSLSLGEGGRRVRPALRMAPALTACWIGAAAGNFLFRLLPWGDVELQGHRGRRPASTPGVDTALTLIAVVSRVREGRRR